MTHATIVAAKALAELLDRENAALRGLDFAAAVALLPEKQRAAEGFAAARLRPDGLPPHLRRELEGVVLRLKGTAAENKQLLERAITVQGRVIGIVVKALPRALDSTPRYGAQGTSRLARLPPVALSASA